MDEIFTKRPREERAAEAEAAGLRWLRQASDAVAEVVAVGMNTLTTVRVHPVPPTREAARRAGRELAFIHLAGTDAFGSPPDGWEGPNYIGTQRQECRPTPHWGVFYAEQRVLPFARAAHRVGHLDREGLDWVERAAEAIAEATWEVDPARIHGDLWSGNLLFGARGPVFIDPAAHGGHPETDLGMLALFGAPHLDDIYAGYREVRTLPKDFREWIPVHQLHPLAVHTYTHGPGYSRPLTVAAMAACERLGRFR